MGSGNEQVKIKITGCSQDGFWYLDSIGQEFAVTSANEKKWLVLPDCMSWIHKCDSEIITESPLADASAELASQGRPLVAESIISEAKKAIIAEGVRIFDTGATRDTDEGKHDIEAFFSPLVTKRRAEFMHLNRKMADGSMRDGDNWQLGHPFNECLKSLCRHVEDIKLLSRGYDAREDIETALCAVMFNCESMLLTRLEEKCVK